MELGRMELASSRRRLWEFRGGEVSFF